MSAMVPPPVLASVYKEISERGFRCEPFEVTHHYYQCIRVGVHHRNWVINGFCCRIYAKQADRQHEHQFVAYIRSTEIPRYVQFLIVKIFGFEEIFIIPKIVAAENSRLALVPYGWTCARTGLLRGPEPAGIERFMGSQGGFDQLDLARRKSAWEALWAAVSIRQQ